MSESIARESSASDSSPDSSSAAAVELSATAPVPVPVSDMPRRRRGGKRTSWLLTLSSVCFVFGGLLAVQLRAMQTVRSNRVEARKGLEMAKEQTQAARAKMLAEQTKRAASEAQVKELTGKLAATGSLSQAQIKKLAGQIKETQALAGLSPVRGRGIRLTISDSPQAREFQDPSGFGPGMVHDFDLQQIVNELRAAKAEAIAIRGGGGPLMRVTGFTPIRCVGPVIQVNYEVVASPFVIEAIGEQGALESVINLPGGVVDNLRVGKPGFIPPLPIRLEKVDQLDLPASENVPKLRIAQPR
jgi:uncharacterized protein YlxW (UPF0749 family)